MEILIEVARSMLEAMVMSMCACVCKHMSTYVCEKTHSCVCERMCVRQCLSPSPPPTIVSCTIASPLSQTQTKISSSTKHFLLTQSLIPHRIKIYSLILALTLALTCGPLLWTFMSLFILCVS